MFKIVLATITLVFITLTGALVLAQDTSEYQHQLPTITPSQCSVPAQLQGQIAVNIVIAEIGEVGRIFDTVDGGCGTIQISDEELDRLPSILLADMSAIHADAKCSAKNSSQIDAPFGNRVEVICTKMISIKPALKPYRSYLVIGVIIDSDGEIAVYFISAHE